MGNPDLGGWALLQLLQLQISPAIHAHTGPGIGTTTGGVNWVGFLTTEQNASLVLSYNLAVGGAGIDNSIVQTGSPDLVSQVNLFESTYSGRPEVAPWGADSAVFGFWIGINESGPFSD